MGLIAPGALSMTGIRELVDKHVLRLFMDCKGYDPTKHTGDYLMALWILSEGIRKMSTGEVEAIGDVMAR